LITINGSEKKCKRDLRNLIAVSSPSDDVVAYIEKLFA